MLAGYLPFGSTPRPEGATENLPRISLARPGGAPWTAVRTDGRAPDLEVSLLLGEGGMGYVHLAHQRSLGREVAIKTVKSGDQVASAALLSEGRVTGRLEHPGIIPVHALGVDDQAAPCWS